MWTLRVKGKFDSAHKLNDYDGPCATMHGHTWHVEVFLEVTKLEPNGISVDFKLVKELINDYLPDHDTLNDLYEFNPTAENLSQHLFRCMRDNGMLNRDGLRVAKIVLWETEKNAVEYYE